MQGTSFLIAARNEAYLEATIRDVLKNCRGEMEVLVALDGYIPDPQIVLNDDRVRFYHFPESIGQRQCINFLAKQAKGKYICKMDAHVAIDEGFDVKLASDCEQSWTIIPRMYNLDINTWKPKLHKLTDYMYITSPAAKKPFRAEYYTGNEYRKWHSRPELIDDTMACMGPCWFMHKDRFFEQGGCDEGHGSWGAMSVEVALKAWLSGGALKVNKKTWFAHWFRGDVGFPYSISGKDVENARQYSQDLWLNNKWDKAVKSLDWVIDKFNPPTWENRMESKCKFDQRDFYKYTAMMDTFPKWMGVDIVKYPNDIIQYQEIIFKNKPDFIIETGTYKGGSSLFFAHMMDIIGNGHVITVDLHDHNPPKHPRITHIIGRATSEETLNKIRSMIHGDVMVVLDSNHHRSHVKRELVRYHNFVTHGQYMVVEDTNWSEIGKKNGPDEAVKWFMMHNSKFIIDPLEKRFVFSLNPGGWLRRR